MEILALIQLGLKFGIGGTILAILMQLIKDKPKLATSEIGTSLEKYEGNNGFRISKNHQLTEKATQEHICIIGPTGANKTTSQYAPNLLEDNINGSIIIADPKGELYKLTHKYQENIGRKTILYKPLEPGGMEYNPLAECKTDREIMQLAQNLLINGALSLELQTGKKAGGIEWIQMSQSLLTAALMDSTTINQALRTIINNDADHLDYMFSEHKNPSVKLHYNAFKTCLESERTVGSIKITISSNLSLFLDKLAINKSTFNADTLRKQPTALYISYPENKANFLSPLMACIYSQLIDKLIDSYTEDALPITFMVDEFANQGQWSNMSSNISTARSRKVSFILCLQSISQLKQIYGNDNALSILNNCKTKIILPGLSDIDTLRYISTLCGEEEIEIMQDNRKVKTKKQLFTMEEIRTLHDDKVLIISNNYNPILDKQNIYYKQQKYIERCK